MRLSYSVLLLAAAICLPIPTQADVLEKVVTGLCEDDQFVAFKITVDFTATGGNFNLGTGTATVKFTLENTSGVYGFQNPAVGNPVLTGFFFNVPSTATVAYTEARVLAGSALVSTGTTMLGVPIPPGCVTLAADKAATGWYELQSNAATGQYGIFTTSLETLLGIKAGLVDPDVYLACVKQGDVFSPLVVAGLVRFTVQISNLDTSLDSAQDFLSHCSVTPGTQQPSAFAGKFQATSTGGEGSCFIGEPCLTVPANPRTWGELKSIYH